MQTSVRLCFTFPLGLLNFCVNNFLDDFLGNGSVLTVPSSVYSEIPMHKTRACVFAHEDTGAKTVPVSVQEAETPLVTTMATVTSTAECVNVILTGEEMATVVTALLVGPDLIAL